MTKILHISDLHDRSGIQLRYIADHYPTHQIIVTGDITDNGTVMQYESATQLIREFGDRLFVVPGNHDYGNVFDSKVKAERFDDYFLTTYNKDNEMTHVWNLPDCLFIGLNSNPRTWGYWGDMARGKLGRGQRQDLQNMLTIHSKPIIIALHHHLKDPRATSPWKRLVHMLTKELVELSDSRKVCRIIENHKNVIVLHGHRHRQYNYRVGEVPVYCAGALFKQTWALEISVNSAGQVGTCYVPVKEADND